MFFCMMSVVFLKFKLVDICETYIKFSMKATARTHLSGWSFLIVNPLSAKFIFGYCSIYINHTSKLWKQLRSIRVVDDHSSLRDDVLPTSTSSTRLTLKTIMMSYVTISLYRMALEEGYFVLMVFVSKVAQPLQNQICAALVFLGLLCWYPLLRKSYGAVSRSTSEHPEWTGTSTASSSQSRAGRFAPQTICYLPITLQTEPIGS